jgi:hypothetical protein
MGDMETRTREKGSGMNLITRKTIVAVDCIQCKETQHITVGTADLTNWENGELIQNAMPYLTAGQREILISGVCETCFDNMFAGEEEDLIGDAETEYDIEFEGSEE